MNFTPFGGHFPTSLPIHQFAAKFGHDNMSYCSEDTTSTQRYTANSIPSITQHHPPQNQQNLTNSKFLNHSYTNQNVICSSTRSEKRQILDQQELAQEICAAMLHHTQSVNNQQQQEKSQHNSEKVKYDRQDIHQIQQSHQLQHSLTQNQSQILQLHHQQNHQTLLTSNQNINSTPIPPWQSLATTGSAVADYLSHLPATTLPISLQQFLKYSAETIKKDGIQIQNAQTPENNLLQESNSTGNGMGTNSSSVNLNTNSNVISNSMANNLGTSTTINASHLHSGSFAKKKKKKPDKERKARPKPGEIRLTTALDGSTLYCCPECHMAYPEKELLEQHLIGHTLERRFVCDICGAGLKRKDHLTRHKQSHNPERPYICTVCLKAFKRKEQLTLHFVIHSGEKRHVCSECGKGFYRKDHLRKHTRSHIARRVKAELSQHTNNSGRNSNMELPMIVPKINSSSCSQTVMN